MEFYDFLKSNPDLLFAARRQEKHTNSSGRQMWDTRKVKIKQISTRYVKPVG